MSGKYIYLLRMAFRNIANDKFAALSVALPLALIIAIVSAITFYIEGVEQDALLAADSFPDILLQQQVGGRTESLLFDRYEDILTEIKEIKSYEPRVWGYINYAGQDSAAMAFVVMGLAPDFINSGSFLEYVIEKGRSLQEGDTNQAIVGGALAAALKCDIGDKIEISSPDKRRRVALEVAGTFDAAVQIYTADLVIVPIETARAILGYYEGSEISDVLVYLHNPAKANDVATLISGKIDGARPLTKQAVLSLTRQSFGQRSGYFHLLWFILLVNILIISWSVISRLSLERRKEIGILKAIGWDTRDIMVLKILETLAIGAVSVSTGLLVGIGYMFVNAPGLKRFIIGWADIYPDFPVPLFVQWQTVGLIIVLGILPLAVATLIPIWRLGATDPVEILTQ